MPDGQQGVKRARHKGLFARFLRTRAIHRLFGRVTIFESLGDTPISRKVPDALAQTLSAAARSDTSALLALLAPMRRG